MLKNVIMTFALLSSSAFAGHLEKVCELAMRQDPNSPQYFYSNPPVFGADTLARRNSSTGEYLVEDMFGKILNSFQVPIKSLLKTETSLWALAPFDLIEMNHHGEVKNIYNIEPTMNQSWGGLSMVKAGNLLVISRGAAGLLAFDLETRAIKWNNYMTDENDGYPSGLAVDGSFIYAAVATSHQFGFTGIITVNAETGAVVKRSPYDVNSGVIDTDAKAKMFKGNLVVNNGGWIHVITPKQIASGKSFKPRWVAKVVPTAGEVNEHYMMINGDFFFENNQLVACGTYTTISNERLVRKSKLFTVDMP